MLKVNDTADITGAKVNAGVQLGSKLEKGAVITLIYAKTLIADGIKTGTLTDGLLKSDISIMATDDKKIDSCH